MECCCSRGTVKDVKWAISEQSRITENGFWETQREFLFPLRNRLPDPYTLESLVQNSVAILYHTMLVKQVLDAFVTFFTRWGVYAARQNAISSLQIGFLAILRNKANMDSDGSCT